MSYDEKAVVSISRPPSVEDLMQTRLFAGEGSDTLVRVLEAGDVLVLHTGQTLFEPGQKNNCLYVVLSGRLSIKLNKDSEDLLTQIHAGSCVGELSVLEGEPASAYVYADDATRLLSLSDTLVWSLINSSRVIARNLLLILSSRVRSVNKVVSDSHAARRLYEQEAKIDALTGLYNRRWLDEALPRWAGRNDRLSLLILDIDHFKQYNDKHGHLGGDAAIKGVAATLTRTLRAVDLAARYGGEEFVALLPGAVLGEAREIAERVRHAVKERELHFDEGTRLPHVTVSLGVAEMRDGMGHLELLGLADTALYEAKRSGRDKVVCANT